MIRTQASRPVTEVVAEKLHNSFEIRAFPQVVVKLMEAIRNPNVSLDHVASIISGDAALCVKVIKMANSPIMGVGQKVSRVDQSINLLGFNRIKALAQTHAAAAVISGSGANASIRKGLWNHSMACATAARIIAERTRVVEPTEAFLAGIFHDVGQLFFLEVVPDAYLELLNERHPLHLVEEEVARFGVNHQDAGMKLAIAWELAEPIRMAIGFHHHPEDAIVFEQLAWVIHLADQIVHAFSIGSVFDSTIAAESLLKTPLNLTPEDLVAIGDQTSSEFEQFLQMYAD